jgi:hypothetical protein
MRECEVFKHPIVLRDFEVIRFPLPERRWQVPRSILHQAPNRAALGFGFELGLGFRTYVTASAPYLLLVALLLLAEPLPLFLLAGAAFGHGRFAMAAARYVGADGNPSGDLVTARAALVRGSSAVVAALGALALVMA